MEILQKTWVRILVSLLLGGILNECFIIATGKANEEQDGSYSFVFLMASVAFFAALTFLVNRNIGNNPPK